jgi:lipopolysaccharide/colanic/teichoic acid biosynthesis glycosyltransferase
MQSNPITWGDASASPLDAELFLHGAAAPGAQALLWDGGNPAVVPDGEGALALASDPAAGPAALPADEAAPYDEQSGRGRWTYLLCKRLLDLAAGLVLLVAALPVIAFVALLVKATSRGPVLFRHRRLGLGGREFDCLKFRTMVVNADEVLARDELLRRRFERSYKLKRDPRVTRAGAFLRRTSLDELPQLLHVLRGEMSLVGPRPIVRAELEKYSIYGDKLLTVKPGLSGLWQVCGRSDTTYPQRVQLDMQYIDNRSLSLDLRLMARTAGAVIRKSGAC